MVHGRVNVMNGSMVILPLIRDDPVPEGHVVHRFSPGGASPVDWATCNPVVIPPGDSLESKEGDIWYMVVQFSPKTESIADSPEAMKKS
jgi:hypothetical protein